MDFYNFDRKTAFIEDYCSKGTEQSAKARKQRANAIFVSISSIEEKYKNDFCEFNEKQMLDVYKVLASCLSEAVRVGKTAILRKYVAWCYKENYIGEYEYTSHPIMIITTSYYDNSQFRSKALSEQIVAGRKAKTDNDFIFETYESFIKYVMAVYSNNKYMMIAAIIILQYYGFEREEIRNLLKTDIDAKKQTVRGVRIEDQRAFDILCQTKNLESYTTKVGENSVYRIEYLRESPYLIRNTTRGSHESAGLRAGESYFEKISRTMKLALNELPDDSPYKKIRITGSTLMKLKKFHEIKKDEDTFGLNYVKQAMIDGKYGPAADQSRAFREYCVMESRARDI